MLAPRPPSRLALLFLSIWVTCLPALTRAQPSEEGRRPNVLFILADDLGWSDTTLHGTTKLYRTPHLERLAARGMKFTRAYSSSPLCSPTRASVLTGLSPARTGITAPVCHLPKVVLESTVSTAGNPALKATQPESVTRLDPRTFTLAERFREEGYATDHFGKWHLGPEPYSPLQHGFDVDLPHHPGPGPAGSYVAPWKFRDFDPDPGIPDQHLEDRMASEAVAFLEKHREKPFFLNYWMFSVHAPFDAKPELVEKYRGHVDENDPQRSPTYAAMIESLDDAVGTLLDALDRLDLADDTIIVFASDNGGNMYNEVDGTTPTSNAPLRGGKATIFEGGIRGPAIVAWPGHVPAGSMSQEIIQSCDFYPTLLELLDLEPREGQSFDGISIVPALRGEPLEREAIFTYFPHSPPVPDWLPPSVAVHSGKWKLIRLFHQGEAGAHRHLLYDLESDAGERNDLSARHPDLVKKLDGLIEKFLEDTGAVVPKLNEKFDPAKYRPELEGQGRIRSKSPKRRNRSARDRKARRAVKGWRPGGTATLELEGEVLVIRSSGGDPHLSFSLPREVAAKKLKLEVRLASDSNGPGQVFWQEKGRRPGFSRERSRPLAVNHDGTMHTCVVEWEPGGPVTALRLDPSTSSGTIRLAELRLLDEEGHVLHRWPGDSDGAQLETGKGSSTRTPSRSRSRKSP